MTITQIVTTPVVMSSEDDDLDHYFCCCSPDTALCGVDLTGVPVGEDDEPECPCVVCDDLCEGACDRCGRTNYQSCVCGRCAVWS